MLTDSAPWLIDDVVHVLAQIVVVALIVIAALAVDALLDGPTRRKIFGAITRRRAQIAEAKRAAEHEENMRSARSWARFEFACLWTGERARTGCSDIDAKRRVLTRHPELRPFVLGVSFDEAGRRMSEIGRRLDRIDR